MGVKSPSDLSVAAIASCYKCLIRILESTFKQMGGVEEGFPQLCWVIQLSGQITATKAFNDAPTNRQKKAPWTTCRSANLRKQKYHNTPPSPLIPLLKFICSCSDKWFQLFFKLSNGENSLVPASQMWGFGAFFDSELTGTFLTVDLTK